MTCHHTNYYYYYNNQQRMYNIGSIPLPVVIIFIVVVVVVFKNDCCTGFISSSVVANNKHLLLSHQLLQQHQQVTTTRRSDLYATSCPSYYYFYQLTSKQRQQQLSSSLSFLFKTTIIDQRERNARCPIQTSFNHFNLQAHHTLKRYNTRQTILFNHQSSDTMEDNIHEKDTMITTTKNSPPSQDVVGELVISKDRDMTGVVTTTASNDQNEERNDNTYQYSLAGPYLVRILPPATTTTMTSYRWILEPIPTTTTTTSSSSCQGKKENDMDPMDNEGYQSWVALHSNAPWEQHEDQIHPTSAHDCPISSSTSKRIQLKADLIVLPPPSIPMSTTTTSETYTKNDDDVVTIKLVIQSTFVSDDNNDDNQQQQQQQQQQIQEDIAAAAAPTTSASMDPTALISLVAKIMTQWTLQQYKEQQQQQQSNDKPIKMIVSYHNAMNQSLWNDDTSSLTFPTTTKTTTTTIENDFNCTIDFLVATTSTDTNNDDIVRKQQQQQEIIRNTLYGSNNDNDSNRVVEMIEMVDRNGIVLGQVPRPLVHQYNLLHRGIGTFVTKDQPIQIRTVVVPPPSDLQQQQNNNTPVQQQQQQQQPDLYVHQRVDHKRIFSSLFDMFVGGISLANEDALTTARREIAEELGLSNALVVLSSSSLDDVSNNSNNSTKFMGPLYQCVICTSYNRCFVTVFSYTMDTTIEKIKWQKEEVQWGHFVPYEIIQNAATLSNKRYGRFQQVQVQQQQVVHQQQQDNKQQPCFGWAGKRIITTPSISVKKSNSNHGTETIDRMNDTTIWDFVPDGLLVWDAWLENERNTRNK